MANQEPKDKSSWPGEHEEEMLLESGKFNHLRRGGQQ